MQDALCISVAVCCSCYRVKKKKKERKRSRAIIESLDPSEPSESKKEREVGTLVVSEANSGFSEGEDRPTPPEAKQRLKKGQRNWSTDSKDLEDLFFRI